MNNYYHSNEAISYKDDDFYNFMPYATKIQEAIRNSCLTDEQIVFGVYGKWGEGKTSFLNLVFTDLEIGSDGKSKKIIKYKFNPWRYNSEEKLLFEFFNGLIKVLNHDYTATNKEGLISKIKEYSKYILSGTTIETEKGWNLGFKFTVKVKQSFKDTFDFLKKKNAKDVESLKNSIDEELKKFNYRIVIFIDDVDRLNKDEIYNIFRLVKLTASFKNITYIMAFDNNLVANAIYKNYGDTPLDGHNYLEKIINIPITLPKVDSLNLLKNLKMGLNSIFSNNTIVIDSKVSINTQHTFQTGTNRFLGEIEGIEHYIRTPRMLIRLLNVFSTNIIALKKEVNYSDLLWLELLKIKFYKTYSFVKNSPELFVKHAGMEFYIRGSENYNQKLTKHIERENYSEIESKEITELIGILFPIENEEGYSYSMAKLLDSYNAKMNTELSEIEKRINHFDFFNVYFSFSNTEKVSSLMLDEFFDTLFKSPESEITKSQFKKIIEDEDKSKMRYELSNRLKTIKSGHKKIILLKLMLKNLDLLSDKNENSNNHSVFFKSPRHELIDKIFQNAHSLGEDSKSALIFQFVKAPETSILDILHTRIGLYSEQFENTNIQKEIDKVLIDKVKEKYSKKAFFEAFEGHISRSIYSIWAKLDTNEFQSYIEDKMTSENTVSFIKSFPTVWSGSNGQTLDSFQEENYDFMAKVLNPNIIYKSVVKFHPKITESKKNYDDLVFDMYDEKDDFTYLLQFAYWHNRKPNKNLLLLNKQ